MSGSMFGLNSGIDYSLLFSSSGSSSDVSTSILNILYGGSGSTGSTTFVSTGNPISDLALAQQEQTQGVAQEAKQPQVASTIAAFQKAVSGATSLQAALGNPTVQQVLLTANGLSSYIGQTALVQKLFMSDPSQSNSLVNQLGNATWLSTVQSYNFASKGLSALQNPQVVSTLTNAYAEVQWRQSLDQATPGLSNALTFLSQASSIKSVGDILDNLVNFEVVTGALGIPEQIVNQSETAQQTAIASRLNVTDLQNHSFVTGMVDQYLLSQQASATSSSSTSTDLTSLALHAQGLIA